MPAGVSDAGRCGTTKTVHDTTKAAHRTSQADAWPRERPVAGAVRCVRVDGGRCLCSQRLGVQRCRIGRQPGNTAGPDDRRGDVRPARHPAWGELREALAAFARDRVERPCRWAYASVMSAADRNVLVAARLSDAPVALRYRSASRPCASGENTVAPMPSRASSMRRRRAAAPHRTDDGPAHYRPRPWPTARRR